MPEKPSAQSQTIVQPCFQVSAPRSGGTLLSLLLDSHPRVFSFGEASLGAPLSQLHRVAHSAALGTLSEDPRDAEELSFEHLRQCVQGLLSNYFPGDGQLRYWLDKDPENFRHLGILQRTFPHARYVFVFRHAMDVAWSAIERYHLGYGKTFSHFVSRDVSNFLAGIVDGWNVINEALLESVTTLPVEPLLVRYEDLVIHPEATLENVLEYLNLDLQPDLHTRAFRAYHPLWRTYGDPNALVSGRLNPSRLARGTRFPLEQINGLVPEASLARMNGLLQRLNYTPVRRGWEERRHQEVGETGERARRPPAHVALFDGRLADVWTRRLEETEKLQRGQLLLHVRGEERQERWLIDTSSERVVVSKLERDDGSSADVELAMDADVFDGIVAGDLNAASATFGGNLEIRSKREKSLLVQQFLSVLGAGV